MTEIAFDYVPDVLSVKYTSARLDPRGGVGVRAGATITFQDSAQPDYGRDDPYFRLRSYYPLVQGTYWPKFLARNPFYETKFITIRAGYLDDGPLDAANFQDRLYVVASLDGPDSSGKVTLQAKDMLDLGEGDKALAPATSTGELATAISETDLFITLAPTGVGDLEYPASGKASVGDEIFSFTRVGDLLSVVRAINGSDVDAHDKGETVQLCLEYVDAAVDDVAYDLLVTYANVDPAYIPTVDWAQEVEDWLVLFRVNTLIVKPTPVNKLLDELGKSCLFLNWWNERDREIKLRAARPPIEGSVATLTSDDNIIEKSISAYRKPEERATRVIVYYDQKDPTAEVDDDSNYRRWAIEIDADAESDDEFGLPPRVVKIHSRWFNSTSDALARELAQRILTRFKRAPRRVTLRVDAKDSQLWLGDACVVVCDEVQNSDGSSPSLQMQVVGATEVEPQQVYEYELAENGFSGRYGLIAPDDVLDYTLATDAQRARYVFICYDTNLFLDATPAYNII